LWLAGVDADRARVHSTRGFERIDLLEDLGEKARSVSSQAPPPLADRLSGPLASCWSD
jgi:hypothetical protein